MKNIFSSEYGVYLEAEGKNIFVASGRGGTIGVSRSVIEKKENEIVMQVELSNTGKEDILVKSIVVAEFLLIGKVEKVLENGWGQSSFSGYRTQINKTKRKIFVLKRDQNPNSFVKSFGYLEGSMVNEWFTQVVFSERSCVIGAVTSANQFTQIYLKENNKGLKVRITCQMDDLILKPGKKMVSEKIAFVWWRETRRTLENFADLIKKYSNTRSVENPPVGLCCAYYFQGNIVSEEYLRSQLRSLFLFLGKTDLKYVEIDAGYCTWGDWLEINNSFPSGMKVMVNEIRKMGLKAGIWFAPYVADPRSNLYKQHPDWFLRNKQGRAIEGRLSSPLDYLPQLSLKVLDPTHPEVQTYIRKVVKQFMDWGFEMLKIDFTYPVCFSNRYFLPVTRARALRMGFEVIRSVAGEKVFLMSAISQLSPLVGVVDSARVGIDTLNPYVSKIPIFGKMINGYMFKESMRNNSARLFLNGKVWINDADCFVGRKGAGLSHSQVDEQFEFMKKYKGAVWVGDSFKTMTKSNLDRYTDLFKKKLRK
ncbi:TPA: hypothetical protein DIU27_01665 [Candidatus Collierbacteria bacterium]|uniref:Alpha-galactosidase n=1 Tax=Candidatus Collierbacteria bacterium GW2011_GWB2_44_22 TaxID=1618387 RepID=A0A0G1K557_9BACT|nr:MAG: Alpha-galactosidase [Candidatus Collierbacteria bacterium GW2011_GWA2_44_13]KKT51422.1 MAG: Alpha-galactosidase [Candidatus Collierbacteria bacterium GW2011_GWB2_44_22]KKT61180.1 MAG: Alpha-galactosidase [Candidatus Collierbacteria bacterium GW2011_GWD1_44_27]KKT65325.1 MAG: Alpha-galactosidase [Candidatus Collierbacteria bacterium GW2011_GWC2_44_30]KKT68270.1 MAG: hypothetical protein UW64_C0024G0005 [Microgenomates group bacterium GW2011_GWC1_44_37]HCQ31075.1 hypothetical protein [Ca